jgi:cysteinyl-tRNA synthetase
MSTIELFNTLTARKELFVPLSGKTVKIYACGPTVYDMSHLGHARMAIIWDVIQRYLRFRGYDVTFVRNITDVEDKIINRAKERKVDPDKIVRQYIYAYWHDVRSLNCEMPDFEPRATEFITRMISFTEELIHKGFAYESKGDVYYEVSKFKEYGKLGKQNIDQLLHGAREQVRSQDELATLKRNPIDFALWKSSVPGELSWDSPWGKGRPGWHLECSTMIKYILGETIDIHGGGEDLVFPHHENEIAQSEALHGKPLARYWLHNGFVQVSSEKMSKSLGNFQTIQDLLKVHSADTIRLLLLQTHYRNPIDFTPDSLVAAKNAVARLARAVNSPVPAAGNGSNNGDSKQQVRQSDTPTTDHNVDTDVNIKQLSHEFQAAMDNDFNTAIALSALFDFADKMQTTEEANKALYAVELRKYADVLGLTLADRRRHIDSGTAAQVVDLVLDLRQEARVKKDFATSDLIRKQLTNLNISVMDAPGGKAQWERS